MSKALASAATSGLPVSRRLFLGGAGTAAVAATAPRLIEAASAAASTEGNAFAAAWQASEAPENPELIRIGADLRPAVQRLSDAEQLLDAAKAKALAAAPAIPDGLPVPYGISIFGLIGWYSLPEPTDILGNPIELPRYIHPKTGKTFRVRIPTSVSIVGDRLNDLHNRRFLGRSAGQVPQWHQGVHRQLYDLAVLFERATEEARDSSGLNHAERSVFRAKLDIIDLCQRANDLEARTAEGLVIKAQAIVEAARLIGVGRATAAAGNEMLPGAICGVLGRAS